MNLLIKSILSLSMMGDPTSAAIPPQQKEIVPIAKPADMPDEGLFSAENLKKLAPQTATNDAHAVEKEMMDKTVQLFMKSKVVQNSSIVGAAKNIESQTSTEAQVTDENGIQHKVDFKILAFQTAARLDYTGLINASALYNPVANNVSVTVTEQITDTAQFQLKHDSHDDLSSVNLNISW